MGANCSRPLDPDYETHKVRKDDTQKTQLTTEGDGSFRTEFHKLVDTVLDELSRKVNPSAMKRRAIALKEAIRTHKSTRDFSSRKIQESFLGIVGQSSRAVVMGRQTHTLRLPGDSSSRKKHSSPGARHRQSLSGGGDDTMGSRARQILYEEVTHENDGFLSPENGFMPSQAPLQKFLTRHEALVAWDGLVEEIRDRLLFSPTQFRAKVDAMPAFPVESINEKELLRASSVVGTVLQTYWYCGSERMKPRQDLLNAWGQIRRRLNWHVEDGTGKKYYDLPFYTLLDYSTYNWRQKRITGHYHVDDLQLDQLQLNVLGMPPVDQSEQHFYMAMLLIMAHGALLPLLCVEAQEAAARADDRVLAQALIHICKIWESITDVFAQVNPHHGAATDLTQTDAIVFSRLFADTAIPMPCTKVTPDGTPIVTPSTGQSVPVFQLMDCFFNRKKFTGIHGADVARHIAAYPRRWGNFIRAIQTPDNVHTTHIDMYIRKSHNPELQGLFAHALQTFAGDNGFLGRHLIKLYGYMTMLFRTGRQATMGGYSGHPLDRTEDRIRSALQESQRDRFAERPGRNLRHTARLYETAVPLGTGDSSMWSVCLDLQGEGMRCSLGDHLRILPRNMKDVGDKFCNLVLHKLGLNPDAEVQVQDLSSWQEQLNYHLGEKAPKIPRVHDIALYGQIRNFAAASDDHATMANRDISLEQLQSITPLTARLYSISVVQNGRSGHVRFLYLTVHEWEDGVASRLLVRGEPGTKVIVQVYQSHVLRRLDEGRTIYFASGTGISPFTNLYSDNTYPHNQWLIWMTKALSDDMQSDFKFISRYNQRLSIDVLATGSEHGKTSDLRSSVLQGRAKTNRTNFTTHNLSAPRGQRLATFFKPSSEEYEELAKWTRSSSLTVLACGNIGFVMEVVNLLRPLVNIEQWIATGRLRVECFGSPGWVPSGHARLFAPWEVLRSALPRNTKKDDDNDGDKGESKQNDDSPPLMIIEDGVYEITQNMLDIHPAGKDLILMYQGADATTPFKVVGHDKDGNATGMLQAFGVGQFNKAVLDNPSLSVSSEESFDLLRFAFDCAEMRNCFLIDDSLHERMTKRPQYSSMETEIHPSCAAATHQRVIKVHVPRIRTMLDKACAHYCPDVKFDELVQAELSPAEPEEGRSSMFTSWMGTSKKTVDPVAEEESETKVLVDWKETRVRDAHFFEVCVSHAADLCEEVADGGTGLQDILLSFQKELALFEQANDDTNQPTTTTTEDESK